MKNIIKWVYFYTPDYEFWHKHLASKLGDYFDLHPLMVSKINASGKLGQHHFQGVSIKIELLIKSIEENIGSSIIFSDCTLWVSEGNLVELREYIEDLSGKYDVIFADNVFDRSANIGLMLINCNKRTLKFFRAILQKFEKTSWDQGLINEHLPGIFFLKVTRIKLIHKLRYVFQWIEKIWSSPRISWSFFDPSKIVCSMNFPEKFRYSYLVYKQFINPSDPKSNWNQRLERLYKSGLIDHVEYKKHIR